MSIRIAVSGAHGVGKTTFCSDLQAALSSRREPSYSVHLVTEVARALKAEGVPINRDTEESQYALFFEKHIANLYTDYGADYVIYDRTILDSLAYATVNGNLDNNWVRFVTTLSSLQMAKIDTYFFIPIEFPITSDGVRSTEVQYQMHLGTALLGILGQCRPKFTVISGSRTERVRRALDALPLRS